MNTKRNLPTILIALFLIFNTGTLFWYGENKIKEAKNINSTIIAWENLLNNPNNINDLDFIIQNITSQKNTYTINWLVNKEKLDSQAVTIISQDKKIIPPTKKVLAKLRKLSKNKQEILYQVKINWDNDKKTEILGKWLK